MATLDYKIKAVSHNGSHATAWIHVYRGSFQDVTIEFLNGTSKVISVFVRAAKVRSFKVEYDLLRTMNEEEFLQKCFKFLNRKIVAWAAKNGHTVIPHQQDTTGVEDVNNEKES